MKFITHWRLKHFKAYAIIAKTSWIILFRDTITVYFQKHLKHINTLCDQNTYFL